MAAVDDRESHMNMILSSQWQNYKKTQGIGFESDVLSLTLMAETICSDRNTPYSISLSKPTITQNSNMRTLCINFEEKYRLASTEEVNVLTYKPIRDFFIFIGRCIAHKYAEDINPLRLIVSYEEETGHTPFTQLWEEMKPILFGVDPKGTYVVELTAEYTTWLKQHKGGFYHHIYDTYYQGVLTCIPVDIRDLYNNSIRLLEKKVLKDINEYSGYSHFSFTDSLITAKSLISNRIAFHTKAIYTKVAITYKIEENGKHGLRSIEGDVNIPCIYDDIEEFFHGIAKVMSNGRYGCININGEVVIPCIYEDIERYDDGQMKVKLKRRYGWIDKHLNTIAPCEYEAIEEFRNGLARVAKYGKYGYLNTDGKVVIPCIYENIERLDNGQMKVKLNGKYGWLDINQNTITSCEYEAFGKFKDGLAKVKKHGQYGCVNTNGTVVIPCIYEDIEQYDNGQMKVKQNGKYGWLDINRNTIIPCEYEAFDKFKD